MAKLTAARRRVLTKLVAAGGRAMPYDLAYPRSNMMHHLRMAGFVTVEGRITGWGDPAHDGFYVITPAGRQALESDNG